MRGKSGIIEMYKVYKGLIRTSCPNLNGKLIVTTHVLEASRNQPPL